MSPGREIRRCGSGKRRFLDKRSADARIEENRLKGKLWSYHCQECDQWHLTRTDPKKEAANG